MRRAAASCEYGECAAAERGDARCACACPAERYAAVTAQRPAVLRRDTAAPLASPADLVGMRLPGGSEPFSLDAREACLYALGVGAGRQPVFAGGAERRFVYEGDPCFTPLPTLAATFPFRGVPPGADPVLGALAAAGLRFEPSALLHGEHELRLHAQLHAALGSGPLRNETRVEAVHDKRSGALVVLRTETRDARHALLATNTQSVFIRGLGGFAGAAAAQQQQPTPPPFQLPARPPDAVWSERVEPGAALLYRLSGDTNPLHVDPAAAARGGFDAPILHGLCTLGYAVRAALLRLCGGEAERVAGVRVRFAGVVFPGETLETSLWRVDALRVAFAARTTDRGAPALAGGLLELLPEPRL